MLQDPTFTNRNRFFIYGFRDFHYLRALIEYKLSLVNHADISKQQPTGKGRRH